MKGFAVFAETKGGRTVLLECFKTKEQAEEHRVRMADYRRVWVEEFPPAKKAVGQ